MQHRQEPSRQPYYSALWVPFAPTSSHLELWPARPLNADLPGCCPAGGHHGPFNTWPVPPGFLPKYDGASADVLARAVEIAGGDAGRVTRDVFLQALAEVAGPLSAAESDYSKRVALAVVQQVGWGEAMAEAGEHPHDTKDTWPVPGGEALYYNVRCGGELPRSCIILTTTPGDRS